MLIMYSVHDKFYIHTISGDDVYKWNTCKNNYQCVVWEKGVVVGKKKAPPFLSQFPPILLLCLDFLHFVDPTVSEPGTG